MKRRSGMLRSVLLFNGIVDLGCAAVLLVLPELGRPLLGYHAFDGQSALFAGGWGVSALALGTVRLWTSTRPAFHDAMLLLGEVEAFLLAAFTIVFVAVGKAPLSQALLPMAVGVVFAALYVLSARKAERG
jgi:hypothetical protein